MPLYFTFNYNMEYTFQIVSAIKMRKTLYLVEKVSIFFMWTVVGKPTKQSVFQLHLPCAQGTDPDFQDTFSLAVINKNMCAKVSKPKTEQGRNSAWLVRKEMSGGWTHGSTRASWKG